MSYLSKRAMLDYDTEYPGLKTACSRNGTDCDPNVLR
jgi:hypothetical protein